MITAFVTHPDCLLHEMGAGHPERPQRLSAILQAVEKDPVRRHLMPVEAPLADLAWIELIHPKSYIEQLEAHSPKSGYERLDADTLMNPHSFKAALRAAGAVVKAVDLVMQKKCQNAFCAVRPPGHHAEPTKAMGFCLFNNVAIGAAYALKHHDLKKVAILDFDVHHGNGTEAAFLENERVMLCSTFQFPFYPGYYFTKKGERLINVPLPSGTDSTSFRRAVEERFLPALDRFQPEFVFLSAGFDAHRDDPLANFSLTEEDFSWITAQAMSIAKTHAQGRLVSTLEGGYQLEALSSSVLAHLKALQTAV